MIVPHLSTSLTGPLLDLERKILDAMPAIEHWFRSQWPIHTPPFYSSVDLRNAGFKLAPVDTNLFPGGFNNLNPAFMPLAVQAMMTAVGRTCCDKKRFLLIPENHTRNSFYLQNVAVLKRIMERAGLEVRLGSLIPGLAAPTEVEAAGGEKLLLEPVKRSGDQVHLEGFDACAVILNNDLSAGTPRILHGIDQTILPPLKAGWSNRLKSHHFTIYQRVADQLAKLIGIDPWLIDPLFGNCGSVDFSESTGLDCLAGNVSRLLPRIQAKYDEYGIKEPPFLIVKADAGTYGMGIMTVRSPDDIVSLNRKTRNKMSVIKDNQPVSQVIIQEGVPTFERIREATAEPVVYMIDQFVVGGFYRMNSTRGIDENLNSQGMQFEPLAFATDCQTPDCQGKPDDPPNRFYAYGVIARLAMLAASIEIAELSEPTQFAPSAEEAAA
jgi:glutamate--cysteine ligase